MKHLTILSAASLFLLFTACGGGSSKNNGEGDSNKKDTTQKADMPANAMKKNGLTVYPIETKDFPNAKLALEAPKASEVDTGSYQFKFSVMNYKLKKATPDADKHNLAESSKGQHIHFIVNNGPYMAKYDTAFKARMAKPGYYTVLAFLSRSYHESVKNPNAFAIKQFKVGNPDKGMKADLSKPHLFYSRPKGTYKGKDMKKLLLDFYPVNVDELSKDGYKVEATLNGTTFTFTEHKPYVIEGLKPGKLKVKLRLLNKKGKLVDSKYSEVTREVTLKAGDNSMSQKKGKNNQSG
jgi:hypothetical protein